MSTKTKTDPTATVSDRDLIITRIFNAPREKVFKAWTDPELLKQWFAPLPYTTPIAELDLRPGGANLIVMRDPQGNDFPNRGVYLEVVENERLVFTNAYTRAWEPSDKPFMTVIVTFEDEGGKTKYTALVRHWTVADRETHEKMGFHQGWGQCADQLEALVTVSGWRLAFGAWRSATAIFGSSKRAAPRQLLRSAKPKPVGGQSPLPEHQLLTARGPFRYEDQRGRDTDCDRRHHKKTGGS